MSREWERVTRRAPCEVCGSTSFCARSSDGRVRKCMRNHYEKDAVLIEERHGLAAYYFDDSGSRERYVPSRSVIRDTASHEQLDAAYRDLLSRLALTEEHKKDLLARGLTEEQIVVEGYRSFGGKYAAGILRTMEGQFSKDQLALIPGFYVEQGKLQLSIPTGLLIPVRNATGQIVAIKIRRKTETPDDPKYIWLSSSSRDGASPGSPSHVPLLGQRSNEARITEGELKASVCSVLSDTFTLSIPGATSVMSVLDPLRELKARRVWLAWDADKTRDRGLDAQGVQKRNFVAVGLEHAMHLLVAEGLEVGIEDWPEEAGKGLDDVLAAGRGDQVLRFEGEQAWLRLVEILEAAKTPPKPETLARVGVAKEPEEKQSLVEEESQPADDLELALREAQKAHRGHGDKKPPRKPPAPPKNKEPLDFERGDEVELAHRLLKDLRADSDQPVLYDRNHFWRYEQASGLWCRIDHSDAYVQVASYAGMLCPTGDDDVGPLKMSSSKIAGVVKIASELARNTMLKIEPSGMFFDNAPKGIALQDVFLRIDPHTGDLLSQPLSAEHRQTVSLPFAWDENADAGTERWNSFYEDLFQPIDEAERLACIQALDEMVGICLFGLATKFQKCFVLTGSGSNGKSTWIKVIRRLFPNELVCSLSPQRMVERQFAMSSLVGKRLNIVGELPHRNLMDSNEIKGVISGDETTAEQKHKDLFTFIPQAGHIFAANMLPKTSDPTFGFLRRFVVIGFYRNFEKEGVEKVDYDLELAAELPGILTRVVKAAQALLRRGHFVVPDSSKSAVHEWQQDSDQVSAFVAECCQVDASKQTPIASLYEAYGRWATATGNKAMNANALASRLKALNHFHRTAHGRFYTLAIRKGSLAQGRTSHAAN